MVEIRNLNLSIKGIKLLKDVNMKIMDGEVCGLIGKNGSGKTLLLKCISGLIPVSQGEVIVAGSRVGKDCDFPEDMGLIIETPSFIEYASGIKNLKQLASYRNKITENAIRESMKKVGLDPDLTLSVRKYSMGMRQKLAIAQAIMESPLLLILDEPFNSLDEESTIQIRKLLQQFKKEKKTIIMTSHNKEDIVQLCDKVYMVSKGQLSNALSV